MFQSIQIQTKQECNLKCEFCPNSYIKQTGHKMTLKLYKKIINELAELNYKGKIGLYLMNEPLMDDRFLTLVKYARSNLKEVELYISTNGTLLNDKIVNDLRSSGINRIVVSCYTKEIYEKVENLNVTKLKFYEKDLKNQFYNRGGNSEGYGNEVEQKYCKNPFTQMYITSNGEAVICCADYKKEVVMGDVKNQSLMDIWGNDKYKHYRKHLLKGQRRLLALCKNCNY